MISSAWSRNLKLWLPSAVFLFLTVVFLGVFALEFADEAQVARTRLARRTEELDVIRAQRKHAQGIVEKVRASEEGLADFYGRRLSTEREALTRILAEIKDLCRRAGIPPTSLAYERQVLEGQDVSRRTITFSVDGTYAQLRQLINFIELSDSFLILDEVALRGNDVEGTPLRISLSLSTLFTANSAALAREPPNLES
ncbi:MAG: hypothetical protein IH936_11940 [Acidobacteria bacterium]|nr:hypothetical protein [Acidobacteriota bacterium]